MTGLTAVGRGGCRLVADVMSCQVPVGWDGRAHFTVGEEVENAHVHSRQIDRQTGLCFPLLIVHPSSKAQVYMAQLGLKHTARCSPPITPARKSTSQPHTRPLLSHFAEGYNGPLTAKITPTVCVAHLYLYIISANTSRRPQGLWYIAYHSRRLRSAVTYSHKTAACRFTHPSNP